MPPKQPPPRRTSDVLDYSKDWIVASVVRKAVECSPRGGRALDLGAGTGRHALYLAEHGFRVTAVDTDEDRLSALRAASHARRLPIEIVNADITAFRPLAKYELIVATCALHFLTRDAAMRAIMTMQRHTVSHGINAVSVHTDQNPGDLHRYLFHERELAACYADWETIHYVEGWSKPFRVVASGEVLRRHRAEIVARKPGDESPATASEGSRSRP